MNLKISLDIDGVLADFWESYLNKFGSPKNDREITRNVAKKLNTDREFWLNLNPINEVRFQPRQYTTARTIPKVWIKEYLFKNSFPKAPVYQIYGYTLSKYSKIRMGSCDVHIDDSLSVFFDLNLKGQPCLLYNTDVNQDWGPIARIDSLDLEEIEDVYHLFKDTLFMDFKYLYDDYIRSK